MMRMKTEIEMAETPKQEAERLRHALFTIRGLDDAEEMKRVAVAAMSGELHGYEIPSDVQQPPYAPIVPMRVNALVKPALPAKPQSEKGEC